MAEYKDKKNVLAMMSILTQWLVPGWGYLVLGYRRRALISFVFITATFLLGLYIGSIGVVDRLTSKPWYVAQLLNSPLVAIIGHISASGKYVVYGKPFTIGQIYTSIAGLMNLLCIINCGHLAAVDDEDEVFGEKDVSVI